MRPEADVRAYEALGAEMFALVRQVPGFLAVDSYGSGAEEISVIRFESLAALKAWRDHPQHAITQQRGRAEFYASYKIEVCEVVRAYDHVTSVLARG